MKLSTRSKVIILVLALIGPLTALWVWLSSLSFVPVPWPDDSAFYFVAKSLFHWPPRWVMLPQAPFEPSYRIWNFNTMPLYPVLIGLGRFVGIDGSHALKFWPLSFWALGVSFFSVAIYMEGLPALVAGLFALALAMDPAMRWGSVVVRPESLIGLTGVILVTGLCLGWFTRKERTPGYDPAQDSTLWDPIAALLAIGAYAHFNAVHLLFAVIPILLFRPQRLIDVALKTTLYLLPWIITVALKPRIFVEQMHLQWQRLAIHNDWLKSVSSAIGSLYQSMGSPEPWPSVLHVVSVGLWLLIFCAIGTLIYPPLRYFITSFRERKLQPLIPPDENPSGGVTLLPAAGWVVGTIWLWNSKPEVWFTYYIHLAVWTFAGLAALKLWRMWVRSERNGFAIPLSALGTMITASILIFVYVNITQAARLSESKTWNWTTYHQFVSCVDRQLTKLAVRQGHPKDFQVWAPTFPDITIELSRRHPNWDLSRTNDFWSRNQLAIQHGFESNAVVVTEMLNWEERDIDAPWSAYPQIHSVWMDWKGYFLNRLETSPGWKPNRHLCQKGRWQAFIFMN